MGVSQKLNVVPLVTVLRHRPVASLPAHGASHGPPSSSPTISLGYWKPMASSPYTSATLQLTPPAEQSLMFVNFTQSKLTRIRYRWGAVWASAGRLVAPPAARASASTARASSGSLGRRLMILN